MNKDVTMQMNTFKEKTPVSHKIAKCTPLKWMILLIPLLFILFTLGSSLLDIIEKSVTNRDGFTLDNYIKILTEPLYLKVLWNTIKTGIIVTVVCLVLAYPVAYLSVKSEKAIVRSVVTGGILIPYWISMLVRIFAWQIILQKNGLINQVLMQLGIIHKPLTLLYTDLAVVISLTHILLPYMFLSLQSNMEGIDRNLTKAVEIMGGKPARGFLDVFFPLSKPGIMSGCLMVFVLSLGFYIAPALLGNPNNMMMSNLIETDMNNFQSGLASALSIELMVIVFLIIGIVSKFAGNVFIQRKS